MHSAADPDLPHIHILLVPNRPGQVIAPHGRITIYVGDTVECKVDDREIRIYAFEVTQAIRDADSARFAYTTELAEENRKLKADVDRLWAALEMYGRKRTEDMELLDPTVIEYLGDPLELPDTDPWWDTPHHSVPVDDEPEPKPKDSH